MIRRRAGHLKPETRPRTAQCARAAQVAQGTRITCDGSAFGLGTRSQRYAAILEDGVVRQLMVEPDPLAVTVSSVAAVLDAL